MDSDNCFWFKVVRIRSLQTIFRIYGSHASRLENILFKRLVYTVQSTRSYVPSMSCDKKNVYLFAYLFLAIIVRSAIDVFLLFVFQSLWLQFRSATAANVNAFVEYSIFVYDRSHFSRISLDLRQSSFFCCFLWLKFRYATAANVNPFLDYS